jgi:phosphatidylglycerophosphatase A
MKPTDYLALAISTFGVGYLPLAPGTWGSLLTVGIFLGFTQLAQGNALVALVLVSIVAVTFAGVWAASRTEELSNRKDPRKVVVDEVAGQLISLFPLALFARWSIVPVIISFMLFRFFDIVKPYPARRLEALEGGLGVMCDDLIAGVYAAAITSVIIAVF